jgi:hypothetical protein
MADVGTWGAAATAVAAAVGSLVGLARQPADVATLRAEVKAARDEVPEKIKAAGAAILAAVDGTLTQIRADLNSVAKRVESLEKWRERHRVPSPESVRAPATSGPDLLAATDKEHERRISALETRTDRMDLGLQDARVTLGNILGKIDAYITQPRAPR